MRSRRNFLTLRPFPYIIWGMEEYRIRRFVAPCEPIVLDVPASKSILNRALLLAALSRGDVLLRAGTYGQDTRDLLRCLGALGVRIDAHPQGFTVHGTGGFPLRRASLDVGSAGTAARFLTAALAVCGGDYELTASEQMKRRPMQLTEALERAGVRFEYRGERGHFPFAIHSDGLSSQTIRIDTSTSTQYASGLLLAAIAGKAPLTVELTGPRTQGSYIGITLDLLRAFGARVEQRGTAVTVFPAEHAPHAFSVEPDLSGACYFYALSLLANAKICVRGTRLSTSQGDVAFLRLLERAGVRLTETEDGILADGSGVRSYDGFETDVRDFSDQALTLAALAPFAASPSVLYGVSHIRAQECDRVEAIVSNLARLGVPACAGEDEIRISPAPIRQARIQTFHDHRVAMAFSLVGAKTGLVSIDDPDCTAKTFEGYFSLLDRITR